MQSREEWLSGWVVAFWDLLKACFKLLFGGVHEGKVLKWESRCYLWQSEAVWQTVSRRRKIVKDEEAWGRWLLKHFKCNYHRYWGRYEANTSDDLFSLKRENFPKNVGTLLDCFWSQVFAILVTETEVCFASLFRRKGQSQLESWAPMEYVLAGKKENPRDQVGGWVYFFFYQYGEYGVVPIFDP